MTTSGFRSIWLAVIMAAGLLLGGAANADTVVVKRDVTLREGPSRQTRIIRYLKDGDSFVLLDDGARRSGYVHVQLPEGGTAWIYYSYVERRPDGVVVKSTLPETGRMAVHYIDVDQGAAALLEFSCGAVMIDAGGRGSTASDALIAYLEAFFTRRPDLNRTISTIFVTHTHIDHNTNLKRIAQTFKIGGYVHNGVLAGSGSANAKWMSTYAKSSGIPAVGVTEDMVVAAGAGGLTDGTIDPVACAGTDPRIRVISGSYTINPGWPDGEFENGNNKGIVIRVDFGKSSFLFTGDMEDTALETLVANEPGRHLLDVDVYTVGHHGSYNGTSQPLLNAMTPKIAVMSMGHADVQLPWTAWAYGHPRQAAVQLLVGGVTADRAVPADVLVADKVKSFSTYHMTKAVYATGWDGTVTVDANADGALAVETGR